jgi:hypothetical protein
MADFESKGFTKLSRRRNRESFFVVNLSILTFHLDSEPKEAS